MRLQIDVLDDKKIVAVWLTRAEDANEAVRARIDGLCREYKPRKYQVAVYKSGREDLHTRNAPRRRGKKIKTGA